MRRHFHPAMLAMAAVLTAFAPAPSSSVHAQAVPGQQAGRPMMLPVNPDPLVVETQGGSASFSIEVADTNARRAAGLMFRTEMDDDRGMLFVFEQTRPVGFWMQNTPMALDLVFIGEDGVIRDILPGEPFSTDTISPGVPVRFVLEVKAGIAEANGIAGGDIVRHPIIDAVAARD
jgi:uncharacterized protein